MRYSLVVLVIVPLVIVVLQELLEPSRLSLSLLVATSLPLLLALVLLLAPTLASFPRAESATYILLSPTTYTGRHCIISKYPPVLISSLLLPRLLLQPLLVSRLLLQLLLPPSVLHRPTAVATVAFSVAVSVALPATIGTVR